MKQSTRILIAIGVLVVIVGLILGSDWLLRRRASLESSELEPGDVPIYVNGDLMYAFSPDDLSQLEMASFVESEEGKTEEGWLLKDILLLYMPAENLQLDTIIVVSSSSRDKKVELTWAEVQDEANMVLFDVSGRGTLKLVSLLPQLDVRDEWIQDSDRIEVITP